MARYYLTKEGCIEIGVCTYDLNRAFRGTGDAIEVTEENVLGVLRRTGASKVSIFLSDLIGTAKRSPRAGCIPDPTYDLAVEDGNNPAKVAKYAKMITPKLQQAVKTLAIYRGTVQVP